MNVIKAPGGTDSPLMLDLAIILSDPNVKAIFVNIFGGIMRCDFIAKGIIDAAKEIKLDVPVIVRLAGTNVGIGKKMLAESGLDLITADDMNDGAVKAIEAIGRKK